MSVFDQSVMVSANPASKVRPPPHQAGTFWGVKTRDFFQILVPPVETQVVELSSSKVC